MQHKYLSKSGILYNVVQNVHSYTRPILFSTKECDSSTPKDCLLLVSCCCKINVLHCRLQKQIVVIKLAASQPLVPAAIQFQRFYLLLYSSRCRRHHEPLKQTEVLLYEFFCGLQRTNDLQQESEGKVRKRIAVCATSTAPLRELTCHMGSHSVTCHSAEVTFPPLPQPIKASTRFSDPRGMQGWVDLVGLVSYRGGIPAQRRSPIQALTGLNVEQLHSCDERCYRSAKPPTAKVLQSVWQVEHTQQCTGGRVG